MKWILGIVGTTILLLIMTALVVVKWAGYNVPFLSRFVSSGGTIFAGIAVACLCAGPLWFFPLALKIGGVLAEAIVVLLNRMG
ncbi:MAG: hypothetical protein J5965_16740 [Aeriscardovia sp.]|nr:hypothetical protein [Aeriscardovia sp.]